MKPMTIEFTVKNDDNDYKQESVSLQNHEELFAYVAPGGGCESMPSNVGEIQMVFLPPEHPNKDNPIADIHATLELGIVFITGPLSEISQTAEEIIDRAGRGELSDAFMAVIGAGNN